jgi:type IV pilus assembly protein PilY1
MNWTKSRLTTVIASALFTLAATMPTWADDTEIFSATPAAAGRPNIMLVIDTSGSMDSVVSSSQAPYDPAQTYSGTSSNRCTAGSIYYLSGTITTTPTCNSSGNITGAGTFNTSDLKCAAAIAALATTGRMADKYIRWRRTGSGSGRRYTWTADLSASNTTDVECLGDRGIDGNLSTTNRYPNYNTANTVIGNGWIAGPTYDYWSGCPFPGCAGSVATAIPPGTQTNYTLFSGNYLNYQVNPPLIGTTRMDIVQSAATSMVNSLSGVNIGLMRYSDNSASFSGDQAAKGGFVAFPMSPVETSRTALNATINSYSPAGWTPLSETLFEAYRYFSGGNVLFGDTSVPALSVPGSRVGGVAGAAQYQSPISFACQKNYVVYLTDGLPTQDNQADALVAAIPDFTTVGGTCDATTASPYTSSFWGPSATAGRCLAPIAQYMHNKDLRSALDGSQTVATSFIAFGNDPNLATAFNQYLTPAATRGGGRAYTAGDLASLETVLTSITSGILDEASTFTAPTVAVNAFNRTQTLSDLYISVFEPSTNFHWPGNVKKFSIQNGVIVDNHPTPLPAVNPATGYFFASSRSLWSSTDDGLKVPDGGAGQQVPAPGSRNVYTYLGANPAGSTVDLTAAAQQFSTANGAITTALLAIGNPGDPTRDQLINWTRGQDVQDADSDTDTSEARHAMGDPIHSQSAIVIYGGTTSSHNINDALIFVATNDGYLHALDPVDGREHWAFIPQEVYADLPDLYENAAHSSKHYGLDGDVRYIKYDINHDGIVDATAGDRAYIYVGTGHNDAVRRYYGFDVTSKDAPKLIWSVGSAELPGLGQAWSSPVVARIRMSGVAQNTQKFVLVIGGGYDPNNDSPGYNAADSVGNHVYMLDALTGTRLWSAGSSGATFNNSRMDHAIPSPVNVMDIDGNGYADRMYVGDMAGQLWRFDIADAAAGTAPSSLVTGGVIASLGTHDDTVHTDAANRRFYNTPDVSLQVKRGMSPFMNIAIGTGYRGHPLNTATQDRFYSIRDFVPYRVMTQTEYNAITTPTQDNDTGMVDITAISPRVTVPIDAKGWKLRLVDAPSTWVGEKVLAPSLTLSNNIIFTTYTPSNRAGVDPCRPAVGSNRVYIVSVFDGYPTANLDGDATTTTANDRYADITLTGLGTQMSMVLTDASTDPSVNTATGLLAGLAGTGGIFGDPNGNGTNNRPCTNANCGPNRQLCLLMGPTSVGCVPVRGINKTYWAEGDAQ